MNSGIQNVDTYIKPNKIVILLKLEQKEAIFIKFKQVDSPKIMICIVQCVLLQNGYMRYVPINTLLLRVL